MFALSKSTCIKLVRIKVGHLFSILSLLCISFFFLPPRAAYAGGKTLERWGDCAQILNPLLGAIVAQNEGQLARFSCVYMQTLFVGYSARELGNAYEWPMSRRPRPKSSEPRFHGMPSLHTTSAWVAPSYVRNFFPSRRALCIPLYAIALSTACSRVAARQHTVIQVIAAACLTELMVRLNRYYRDRRKSGSVTFDLPAQGGGRGRYVQDF